MNGAISVNVNVIDRMFIAFLFISLAFVWKIFFFISRERATIKFQIECRLFVPIQIVFTSYTNHLEQMWVIYLNYLSVVFVFTKIQQINQNKTLEIMGWNATRIDMLKIDRAHQRHCQFAWHKFLPRER